MKTDERIPKEGIVLRQNNRLIYNVVTAMENSILQIIILVAVSPAIVMGQGSDPDPETSPGGTLTGRTVFVGDPVPPRKIKITKDAPHCDKAGGEFQEVKVGEDGGLADVVIEITGVDEDLWSWKDDDTEYELRQEGCQFKPWLIVVPNGKNVTVYNDDEVTHNVNTGLWNQMQASGADPVTQPIEGRQGIRVSCNIHSWMEAWIYPARSPFYAHTSDDGKFQIEGVPPGKYRCVAWHPSLGRKKFRITIEDGQDTEQTIEFESPQ